MPPLYPKMRERPPECRINYAWPYYHSLGAAVLGPMSGSGLVLDESSHSAIWRPSSVHPSCTYSPLLNRFMWQFRNNTSLRADKYELGPTSISIFAWIRYEASTEGTFNPGTANPGGTIFSTRNTEASKSPDLCISPAGSPSGLCLTFVFATASVALGAKGVTQIHLGTTYAVCGRFNYSGSGQFLGTWDVFLNGTRDNPSSNNFIFAGSASGGFTDFVWNIADEPRWGGMASMDICDILVVHEPLSDDSIMQLSDPSNVDLRIGSVPLVLPPRRRFWPVVSEQALPKMVPWHLFQQVGV